MPAGSDKFCRRPHGSRTKELGSVDGEAVEQAVAARALQVGLAAAAVRAARGMRRVPGLGCVVVAQSLPVVMTDHRRAGAALRPVAAGAILTGRKRPPVGLRTGQHVVPIGRVATAVDHIALFAERGLLAELVVGAMQVVDVLRDHVSLGIPPRAGPDAVAGIDGLAAAARLRTEIGAPGLAACSGRLRKLLAMSVRALDAAEVGALAGAGAGEEKRHGRLLCLRSARAERQQGKRGKRRYDRTMLHLTVLPFLLRSRRAGEPRPPA